MRIICLTSSTSLIAGIAVNKQAEFNREFGFAFNDRIDVNLEIARRQGWTELSHDFGAAGEGRIIGLAPPTSDWRDWGQTPDYTGDMEAAISLFMGQWYLHTDQMMVDGQRMWIVRVETRYLNPHPADGVDSWMMIAAQPAEALALIWLMIEVGKERRLARRITVVG